MALNANALTDVATAKEHLDIPSGNVSRDAQVERLVNVASDLIEQMTERKLKSQTIIEVQDGRQSDRILLKQWPVTAVTSVHIDNEGVFGANTLMDADEYDLDAEGQTIFRRDGGFFLRGNGNIRVEYTAGYSTVPSSLEHACLVALEYLDVHNNDRRSGLLNKSKAGENVGFIDGLPQLFHDLIEPFKRADIPAAPTPVLNA